MVRYVLRTAYNSVIGVIILLGEAVTNTVFGQISHILKNVSSQFLDIVFLLLHLSKRLETFSIISEEHWENGEISFKMYIGTGSL